MNKNKVARKGGSRGMPLQSVSTNEVFTVRVYKLYNQYRWANTYEIVAVSDQQNTGETFWRQLADRFASLESSILFEPIQVDRIVISSYVPDGTPYNPYIVYLFYRTVYSERDLPILRYCLQKSAWL